MSTPERAQDAAAVFAQAEAELEALRRDAARYRVLRRRWIRFEELGVSSRAEGLDVWCDKQLDASGPQPPEK